MRRAALALALVLAGVAPAAAQEEDAPSDEAPEAEGGGTPEEPGDPGGEGVAPDDAEVPGEGSIEEDAEAPAQPEAEAPPEDEPVEEDPYAEESLDEEEEEPLPPVMVTGDVVVEGQAEELFRIGGSAHVLGEEELAQLSYNDPMAVLTAIPGVYVRSEEGFGLRPNVGLRGAASERSRKITLMEDGVLLGPAPYSAPAAYYFPLMARMVGVEVFAGPAAIPYGPATIGGALDLITRGIPTRREGHVDLSLGNTWYGRAHVHYGDSNEWGGFLIEALHLRSSGYQELDVPPNQSTDTGFHRTDVIARGELHGMLDDRFYHRLELSFGLGLEESDASYLGLTDADFRATPYRQYAATQLDHMAWWRTRVHVRYTLESDDVELRVVAYRHDFQRTWYRLDHFCDNLVDAPEGQADTCTANVGFDRILRSPGAYPSHYGRLTGDVEAMPGDAPLLMLRNHRVFAVQGVQADGRIAARTGDFTHRVRFGARVHFDEITRDHRGDTYYLERRQMVQQASDLRFDDNHDSAWALAGFLSWGISLGPLTVSPGARTELIWTRHEDRFTGLEVVGEQYALLPGIGAQVEVVPGLAAFAGAHLGFSPVAPGSGPEVLPEVAWNYEVGARYGRITDPTHAQLTFFASDYDNLSSVCTFTTGCAADMLDEQLNAGEAVILGIEAEASHTFVVDELRVPISASYTWTWTRLTTDFVSPNPQFGSVEPGDQLPYVPEHQLSARAGFHWRFLELFVNGVFTSWMRDVAGHGEADPAERTDDAFLLDARAAVEVTDGFRIYVRGENLTNAQPLMTRRAWGARGTRPLLVQSGVEIDFR